MQRFVPSVPLEFVFLRPEGLDRQSVSDRFLLQAAKSASVLLLPLIPPNTSRQHSRAIPEIDPSVVPPPPPPRRRNPILRRSATVAQVGGTHDCRRDRSGAISQFVVVAGHGPNMDDVSPPLEWD